MSNHLNFLKEYKIIFSIVIISKIIVFLVFPLIFTILHLSRADTFNPFTLWNVWDAPHYIDIASKGYQLTGDTGNFISFFPLLPLLIRLTSFITAQPFLISGYIISTISCFVIAYYFFKLVLLDYPKKIATRSVLLLFIFPTSIFLHAVYTESLFLALTISAFYYLRCKKYLISFVLIAIAGFTRNMTFALLPALLVEIWIQDRKIFTEKITSVVFFIFIGTSGFFAYLLLNFFLFGNFLHFVDVEKLHWHTNFTPFGQGLVYTYNSIFWRTGLEKYTLGIGQIIRVFVVLLQPGNRME
jgi:Gpi18-like mannosyltransferase